MRNRNFIRLPSGFQPSVTPQSLYVRAHDIFSPFLSPGAISAKGGMKNCFKIGNKQGKWERKKRDKTRKAKIMAAGCRSATSLTFFVSSLILFFNRAIEQTSSKTQSSNFKLIKQFVRITRTSSKRCKVRWEYVITLLLRQAERIIHGRAELQSPVRIQRRFSFLMPMAS